MITLEIHQIWNLEEWVLKIGEKKIKEKAFKSNKVIMKDQQVHFMMIKHLMILLIKDNLKCRLKNFMRMMISKYILIKHLYWHTWRILKMIVYLK
jgi:hypothetical protein